MSGWHHDEVVFKSKKCPICDMGFTPRSGVHKYCSQECKDKAKYVLGTCTTESQYGEISGNWERYLSRIIASGVRERKHLSRNDLLSLLEKQDYKCALSGEPLTCNLRKGIISNSNASLDQIIPGKGYTTDNMRFVQRIFNIMKWNQLDVEFIENCKKVVAFNGYKEKKSS